VSVVVDSNLVAALLLPLPNRPLVRAKRAAWIAAGERLVAPALMEYEVCSTLRKVAVAGWVAAEKLPGLIVQMRRLDIQVIPPTVELHTAALRWAERLGRARTYDAQYMAVAEEFRADFWTGDVKLFNRARQLGIAWVHCIAAPAEAPA